MGCSRSPPPWRKGVSNTLVELKGTGKQITFKVGWAGLRGCRYPTLAKIKQNSVAPSLVQNCCNETLSLVSCAMWPVFVGDFRARRGQRTGDRGARKEAVVWHPYGAGMCVIQL